MSAVEEKSKDITAYLTAHKFSDWPLHPLGIPLFAWWCLLFLVNEVWLRAAGTIDRDRWIAAQHAILSKTSGNIDSLSRSLRATERRLPVTDAKTIVRSFLARAVDYAALFVNDPKIEFRACCLVVERRRQRRGAAEQYLQAWEYDAPHKHCNYSRIPLGKPLAGAIAVRKESLFIDDILDPANANYFPNRHYRSIVGFPLLVGGPSGEVLGVVTIDATQPGVFSKEDAASKIEDAVSPILASIALTLDSTRW